MHGGKRRRGNGAQHGDVAQPQAGDASAEPRLDLARKRTRLEVDHGSLCFCSHCAADSETLPLEVSDDGKKPAEPKLARANIQRTVALA
jgi:hypothetical protein